MKELCALARSADRYAAEVGVRPEIHLDDFIFRFLIENKSFDCVDSAVRYYFHDALKSARQLAGLLNELGITGADRKFSMLEFASGYGCVTRQLKKEIPSVHNVACDIHENAVDFIRTHLDTDAILSCSNPKKFRTTVKYEVVFALSFFSHMPIQTWGHWLRALYASVNHGGALIFTTQGMHSAKFFGYPDIPKNGFWFLPDSEQKDLNVSEYGQTIVTEAFVRNEALLSAGRPIDIFRPGFWWEHQDLYVIKKP